MRQKTGRHIEQGATDFLLTGKVFCGLCGDAMTGDSGTSKNGVAHYYYTCHGRKSGKGCKKRSVRKDYLEDLVLRFIVDQCLTGQEREKIADAIIEAQKKQDQSSPLAAMEKELGETEKKIDNINRAIESGVWNSSTSVRLKALEDTADDLRLSIEKMRFTQSQLLTRDRVLFYLDKMAHYDLTRPGRRRQLIDAFLNAVFVYDDFARVVINCVDGNATLPLSDLEALDLPQGAPCSDSGTTGAPFVTHPNTRMVIYTIAV